MVFFADFYSSILLWICFVIWCPVEIDSNSMSPPCSPVSSLCWHFPGRMKDWEFLSWKFHVQNDDNKSKLRQHVISMWKLLSFGHQIKGPAPDPHIEPPRVSTIKLDLLTASPKTICELVCPGRVQTWHWNDSLYTNGMQLDAVCIDLGFLSKQYVSSIKYVRKQRYSFHILNKSLTWSLLESSSSYLSVLAAAQPLERDTCSLENGPSGAKKRNFRKCIRYA